MRSLLLIVFLIMNLGISQDKYPADTLLRSPTSSILEKATILPISAWQRLSYNSVLLSCQFYPSCSNYGGLAISEHGPFVGLAITADRIVRCSPFALEYHYDMNGKFHYPDYRLIDPLQITNTKNNSNKSPLFAAGLSMILPGSGRIYAGRFRDGLMGMWMVAISGTAAYSSFQEKKIIKGNLFSVITLIFYSGEIYGAYRTAKYYQHTNANSDLN
jgi:putative component of membrane protein insertase Oxa1/YidC/SpoIIIJ protein YidD/TM2 domain-containing membrane protein YozV